MNEGVEASGKTVEDAIDAALEQLGATEDEVEVRILSEGGFSEPARVRVKMRDERTAEERALIQDPASPAEDDTAEYTSEELNEQADAAAYFLEELLEIMDFDAEVDESISHDEITVELTGDDMGLLIGRHGATLEALQDLTRAVVKHQTGSWPSVTVDIEGYQERRRETLTQRARSLADKVTRSGRPVDMPPMSAAERKVVHEVIAEYPGLRTESEGFGPDRHIVIHPAAQ